MPSIIPALPTRPTANVTSAIMFTGTYALLPSDVRYFASDTENRFLFNEPGLGFTPNESINNAGILWIKGAGSATVLAANNIGNITNSGIIVAEAESGNASAISIASSWSTGLTNSGSILSTAVGGSSIGVKDFAGGASIINSGVIAAQTNFGATIAVWRSNGGVITNAAAGSILAEGPGARAIQTAASSQVSAGVDDITNHGRIEAASTDGVTPSIGIAVNASQFNPFSILNSGTIKADIAYYSNSYAFSPPQNAVDTITNTATGRIEGDIFFDLGDDEFINNGILIGNVQAGNGNDVIDTTSGSFQGLAALGFGNDIFRGSAGNDAVIGDSGDDIIEGNAGADLLIGDRGADTLIGGAGNDGLYGSFGDDIIRTSGGDVAVAGTGNDTVELGDYAIALAAGGDGFDTLILPNIARVLNLSSVIASGRVTEFETLVLRGGTQLVVRSGNVSTLTGGETELVVTGTAADTVNLIGGWIDTGPRTIEGIMYQAYTLSGQTILVLNSIAVTIAASAPTGATGLDSIAAGAAAALPGQIPGTALLSNLTSANNFDLTENLEIEKGEIWQSQGGVQVITSYNQRALLTNGGIINSSNSSGPAFAVNTYGLLELNNSGTISASAGTNPNYVYDPTNSFDNYNLYGLGRLYNNRDSNLAIAFQSGGSAPVYNTGVIRASATTGGAIAIVTWLPDLSANGAVGTVRYALQNFGNIEASSTALAAIGVVLPNSGRVLNNGNILVQGGVDAVGIEMQGPLNAITVNSGSITARVSGTNSHDSIGIRYWLAPGTSDGAPLGTLTNTGVITAEFAIFVVDRTAAYRLNLINNNRMNGDVQLARYDDIVTNTGVITGSLRLGGGNDVFDGRGGSVLFGVFGGAGNDSFTVDGQTTVISENVGEGMDNVSSLGSYYLYENIENLTLSGSANLFGVGNVLANVITGNAGNNLLIAGGGDDTVHGGAGVDSLFGQDGADRLNGDAGVDYLVGGIGNDIINGGNDADALYGEDGNDTLTGGASFSTDILVGGNGNDALYGNSGLGDYDLMDGGAGNDVYYVDTPADLTFEAVGGGTDTVYANIAGAGYHLYAHTENLVLQGNTPFGVGNELDNSLTGNATGNYLLGGAGNDRLNGMAGNDVLFGQAGADTFIFTAGGGGDVIGDFARGSDRIDLAAYGFASFAALQATFSQVGANGAINLGGGNFIVLNGVTMSQLTAADFLLAAGAAKFGQGTGLFSDPIAGDALDSVLFNAQETGQWSSGADYIELAWFDLNAEFCSSFENVTHDKTLVIGYEFIL
jgi:Ca2+-binding RTX toxin-like protein